MIGNNEFVVDSWKPGQYYIDTITFLVPEGIFGMKQVEKLYVSHESKLIFELKANSISNIGSFHCEIKREFGKGSVFNVISRGAEIDKIVLKDIIIKSKGSAWEKPLSDYNDQKYPNGASATSSGI
jgi:hypothetical protein